YVTDNNNNVNSATAVVTVVDTIDPVAKTRNITVYLDQNGTATITPARVDNGSSDICEVNLSISQSVFTCADRGLNMEMLTVDDGSGNTSEAQFLVEVRDTIRPTLLPKNITVQLGATGQASISP